MPHCSGSHFERFDAGGKRFDRPELTAEGLTAARLGARLGIGQAEAG